MEDFKIISQYHPEGHTVKNCWGHDEAAEEYGEWLMCNMTGGNHEGLEITVEGMWETKKMKLRSELVTRWYADEVE